MLRKSALQHSGQQKFIFDDAERLSSLTRFFISSSPKRPYVSCQVFPSCANFITNNKHSFLETKYTQTWTGGVSHWRVFNFCMNSRWTYHFCKVNFQIIFRLWIICTLRAGTSDGWKLEHRGCFPGEGANEVTEAGAHPLGTWLTSPIRVSQQISQIYCAGANNSERTQMHFHGTLSLSHGFYCFVVLEGTLFGRSSLQARGSLPQRTAVEKKLLGLWLAETFDGRDNWYLVSYHIKANDFCCQILIQLLRGKSLGLRSTIGEKYYIALNRITSLHVAHLTRLKRDLWMQCLPGNFARRERLAVWRRFAGHNTSPVFWRNSQVKLSFA